MSSIASQPLFVVCGASLGGVAAAWRLCESGRRVLLAAEHDWLGGQLTAQAVPPDEHALIELGGATASYRRFREALRDHYRADPAFIDRAELTEGCNPGDGWVSRLCVEPRVAAELLEAWLAPHVQAGRLRIARGVVPVQARREGRRILSLTLRNRHGQDEEVHGRWFFDATDTGELLRHAGLRYRLGKEAADSFGEADAPPLANPLDQQPVTAVMALRLMPRATAVQQPARPPEDYAHWRQAHLPGYGHALFSLQMPGAGPGQVASLPLFGTGQTLDWWRYRRIVARSQWRVPRHEVSLVNWAQNDFAQHPLLDGPLPEHEVAAAARRLSLCLLHWLRTEAPRADGGRGHPELVPASDMLGTPDGLAQQVYVRESRRIVGLSTLTQCDIIAAGADSLPLNRSDSVGTVWYPMDIHPTCVSGRGANARVRPFTLPLGSFIAADCDNLLPACKNLSVTHLVSACTRVHPAEWLAGEVAALLAHEADTRQFALAQLHASAAELRSLQTALVAAGVPIRWTDEEAARAAAIVGHHAEPSMP
ncbi:FAD-dependent oxidoreductase [Rubrivivax rivuli]|nr:FAD-dependent oxidoreductase [Rubrivivax rivuli]